MAEGGMATGTGRVAGPEAEGLHLQLQAQSRESKLKRWDFFKLSESAPSDIFPPARPHLLNLPTVSPSGNQVFKCPGLRGGGCLSFKPPQKTKEKR